MSVTVEESDAFIIDLSIWVYRTAMVMVTKNRGGSGNRTSPNDPDNSLSAIVKHVRHNDIIQSENSQWLALVESCSTEPMQTPPLLYVLHLITSYIVKLQNFLSCREQQRKIGFVLRKQELEVAPVIRYQGMYGNIFCIQPLILTHISVSLFLSTNRLDGSIPVCLWKVWKSMFETTFIQSILVSNFNL